MTMMKTYLMIMLVFGQTELGPTETDIAHTVASPNVAVSALVDNRIPASVLLDLIDLKRPLPFKMHSWPVDADLLIPANRKVFIECARLTGSFPVSDFYSDNEMMYCASVAQAAGCGITLNTSPWHRTSCDGDPSNWDNTGREITWLQNYLIRALKLGLPVDAVALDSECYKYPNPMVTARNNLVFSVCKTYYPTTPIYWYRNGDWAPQIDADHDNRTVAWYRPYAAQNTELWLQRWQEKNPAKDWAMWITLGSGYGPSGWTWDLGLDDLEYVYLGRITRESGNSVLLYPGFYRKKVVGFHEAFTSFIEGATH